MKKRLVLSIVLGLVALALVIPGGLYLYSLYRYGEIPKIDHADVSAIISGAPFDVLIAGSDSRAGLTTAQQKEYGNETETVGSRSDVTMILRVDPTAKKIAVLSIPYDTVVPIAGTRTTNEISAALNLGPGTLVQTVEQDFHIPINAFVSVNFNGVLKLTQALGGINVYFPFPSKDKMSGLSQNAGCQLLNGTQALALARSRFFYYYENGKWQYDDTGEFGRIHRQHTVIRAMISKAESSMLGNPLALNRFIGTAVHDVSISRGLSFSQLVRLALDFRSFSSTNLSTMTLPTQIGYEGVYAGLPVPSWNLDAKVISQVLSSGSHPADKQGTGRTSVASTAIPGPQLPSSGAVFAGENGSRPNFDPTSC